MRVWDGSSGGAAPECLQIWIRAEESGIVLVLDEGHVLFAQTTGCVRVTGGVGCFRVTDLTASLALSA